MTSPRPATIPGSTLDARFERDVMPHVPLLHAIALRLTLERVDAEDLVQETLMKAYANFESFAEGSNLTAWLRRIMTNGFITTYRAKQRRPEHLTERIDEVCRDVNVWGTSSHACSAETAALNRLPCAEIRAAMDALPPEFRMVIIYADLEGRRYREIADLMETPVGTVMSRLHRGRHRLRVSLADYYASSLATTS